MTDHDPDRNEAAPHFEAVLTALDDDTCRAILAELSEPMTATNLSDTCDIPQSTLYRKLELLSQATLVHEHTSISPNGGRTTVYERDFTDIRISIDPDGSYSITIDRPVRHADERLAQLWSDMSDEL